MIHTVYKYCIKWKFYLQVQLLYYSEDNMIYSICLTKPFVFVEQESQNGVVSVKVTQLQLAIHQGDKEHAINVFKG